MKRGGIILTIILSIFALIVGFGGATTALLVTQPAESGSSVVVDFEVVSRELVRLGGAAPPGLTA